MRARLHGVALWVSLVLLSCQGLSAQSFDKQLTLNAFLALGRNPTVHSFAKATLFDANGQRIFNAQVILGHQVADETAFALRFNSTIITEIGLANSTTGDMGGDAEHCYSARMIAHANSYSLHETMTTNFYCIPDPVEIPRPPDQNCPILLDLGLNGFHLSGPDPAVRFDIDADGTPDNIAWTRADGDDAFLCMDRNHNGKIDDGAELFGFATPLLSGQPAKIGYLALAELDKAEAGGNGDGKIDANDLGFRDLRVWIDGNRDGISQPGEIYSLAQVNVLALYYTYGTIRLVDPFGNLFRYVSRVDMRGPGGAVISWPTYDVIFAER
jgi:hypothetical protein